MERWNVECPHCKEYNDIKFSDIRYEYDTEVVNNKKHYAVTSIWYMCPDCGCVSTEQEMKKQPAKWIAENPKAYEKGIRSFWLNSFVSPWATWESTILAYLEAIGSTEKLQVVYNTRFGLLWENRGDNEDEESVMSRREEYPAELPDGVLVLTAGVDTQNDRMEYEIVGHGAFKETWGIESGIIMGKPDEDKTWEQLDEVVFDRVMKFKDGIGLRVSISFVDEGGHYTHEVRRRCRDRIGKKVFAIAGSNKFNAPFTDIPRKQKIMVENKIIGYCYRYEIGVSAGKQMIMDRLRVQTPGPKYCHFPKRDDYGYSYFSQLLSEHLTYDDKLKQKWVWKKIPGRERNERLDCRNYALAAFEVLPVDLDAIARRLIEARSGKPAERVATAPAPKKKVNRSIDATLDKFYDSW